MQLDTSLIRRRLSFFVAENGLLSYENPNYHLDPARLDDALNSNDPEAAVALYKEIYNELDAVCNLHSRGGSGDARRHYASLDLGAMGVDVSAGPTLNFLGAAHSPDYENNRLVFYTLTHSFTSDTQKMSP
jgi:hypothetical protein